MKIWLGWMLLLLAPALAVAGELILEPAAIAPGEVALLRWQDQGPATGAVEFNGRKIPLDTTPSGGQALLGLDLGSASGTYPVRLDLVGAAGPISADLQVVAITRQEERLDLPKAMVSPQDPAVIERIQRDQALLKELFAGRSAGTVPNGFRKPVADPIGSPFGLRRVLNGQPRSPHAGIDFRSPRGTSVRASAGGVVAYAGDLYFTGLTVILDHGDGLFSLYCHLERIDCTVGSTVRGEQMLGRVGSTGRSTGAHLHWGVKLRGDRVDPLALVALLGGKKS